MTLTINDTRGQTDGLRERLFHTPYITITDEKVVVNHVGRIWEYNLADVHRFELREYRGYGPRFYISTAIISVHYKRNVEAKKMKEAKGMDGINRKMNVAMTNAQDGIHANNLTMKPKQLCDLLNEATSATLASFLKQGSCRNSSRILSLNGSWRLIFTNRNK